jgi:hypothetical protein
MNPDEYLRVKIQHRVMPPVLDRALGIRLPIRRRPVESRTSLTVAVSSGIHLNNNV